MTRSVPHLPALALAAGLALALPGNGHAAHPTLTDDTGTQGAGGWQLELVGEHLRIERRFENVSGGVTESRSAGLISPVLTYGVLDNLDLALGFNHLWLRASGDETGSSSAHGRSDSTVELKWRFLERGESSLALKPTLVIPTGDEGRGLGTGEVSWGASLIATREARPWVVLANLAYLHARYRLASDAEANRTDLWRASAGIGFVPREDVRLVAEAGVRTNLARSDRAQPGRYGVFGTLGVIWSPTSWLDLDLGARFGNRAEADTAALAGVTMRW